MLIEFLSKHGYELTPRKIRRIVFEHKGEESIAEVGQLLDYGGKCEEVLAIFEARSGSYLVCTPSRGGDRVHLPILTGNSGDDLVKSVEEYK
jgi:hypothetical protein